VRLQRLLTDPRYLHEDVWVHAARAVRWEGFYNARDLGGLPTVGGGVTRFGAFYRSATVEYVTRRGWRQAYDAGVRTVLDLRNDDEVGAAVAPPGVTRVREPLDGIEDTVFWEPFLASGLHGTPLYYEPFLRHKSARVAAVMSALARADGAVVFHCGGGHDRTGLITLLLLLLAGVDATVIAEDYLLDDEALHVRSGRTDDRTEVEALLAAQGTDARQAVHQVAASIDPAAYLCEAGLSRADIDRLRERLTPLDSSR
jgi:hypothetical protein